MKERLTGAIILVALIVVLVPELLSGPIRPTARAHGPTPSAEEPPLRSYTIDLADDAHGGSGTVRPQPASAVTPAAPPADSAAASPGAMAAAAEPSVAPPAQSSAPPQTTQPQPPAPAQRAPAPPSPPPAAASGTSAVGYVVQLGSFASLANADKLAQHIRALGFTVTVSRGTTGRRLYRVQVGPAHDRAGAEQILSKLRAQGQKGSVVPK